MSAASIHLTLRVEDAEPILRQAAFDAAKFGGYLDNVPRRIWNSPARGSKYEESRAEWRGKYLAAKRIVEAFGVEVELADGDFVGTHYPHTKGGKREILDVGGLKFAMMKGAKTDHSRPEKQWLGVRFQEAAEAAQGRAVAKWRELVGAQASA